MSVLEIETNMKSLPEQDLKELIPAILTVFEERSGDLLADLFHAMWDKQIEQDLDSGKFDALYDRLVADYRKGLSKPLN